MEIIGVSRTAHYGRLKNPTPPVVYMPYNQGYPPPRSMTFELRSTENPLAYVKMVREIVHQADDRVPVTERTQVADINQTISQEITFAKLCTGFATLALVIACIGLYGTVSYNVARRTGEIGIRMALGAQRSAVAWMVLSEVIVLASIGLAVSVPAALTGSRLIRSFLFGLTPNDPLAITTAVGVLAIAALLAGYLARAQSVHDRSHDRVTTRISVAHAPKLLHPRHIAKNY
jgi:macrolide transport system ATP-binding/permease protein